MTESRLLRLVAIDPTGDGADFAADGPALEIFEAYCGLYDAHGYHPPWIGYFALVNGRAVGTCGFKSPPRDKTVEIAYHTFPHVEGRGHATAMARELIALARSTNPAVTVIAHTLPEVNASTSILQKVGFEKVGLVDDPSDGAVWRWTLPEPAKPSGPRE